MQNTRACLTSRILRTCVQLAGKVEKLNKAKNVMKIVVLPG